MSQSENLRHYKNTLSPNMFGLLANLKEIFFEKGVDPLLNIAKLSKSSPKSDPLTGDDLHRNQNISPDLLIFDAVDEINSETVTGRLKNDRLLAHEFDDTRSELKLKADTSNVASEHLSNLELIPWKIDADNPLESVTFSRDIPNDYRLPPLLSINSIMIAAGPVEIYGSPVEVYGSPIEIYATPQIFTAGQALGVAPQIAASGGSGGAMLAALAGLGLAGGGGSKGSSKDVPAANPPSIKSAATSNFAENATGTVYQIIATADAGARLNYSISGLDSALFSVDANTGSVTFKTPPDFESPLDVGFDNNYNITVTASDGKLSSSLAVAIAVTNIYEGPSISSAASVNFNDHGTGVAYNTRAFVDASKTLTYSITGVDSSLFTIDSAGAVRFKTPPSFLAPVDNGLDNAYEIRVTADDGSQSAIKDVVIQVTSAPSITSGLLTASIFENTDAPATISTPYRLLLDQTAEGKINSAGDHDFYKVYLDAGKIYSFAMTGIGLSDLNNPYLRLYDANGNFITSDDDGLPGENSFFNYTPTYSSYYYLDAASANSTSLGNYSLAFSKGSKASFNVEMGANDIEGYSWSDRAVSAEISYGFRRTTVIANIGAHNIDGNYSVQLTSLQRDMVKIALLLWSDVCLLNFKDVNNSDGFTDAATILIGNYSNLSDKAGAFASIPVTANMNINSYEGDLWLNNAPLRIEQTNLKLGTYSASAILHELGHAMGLLHPGLYDASQGTPTYITHTKNTQDTYQYTQMSYFPAANTLSSSQMPNTPMMFDILAAQETYGVNSATRVTNTIYGFNSNAGAENAYLFSGPVATSAFCIWDAGGIDTIDVSGFSQSQLVNLSQASFSNTGGLIGNLSIAFNCDIENAIGGSGNDVLFGNGLDNKFTGGRGNDQIYGGLGIDTVIFNGPQSNYKIDPIVDGYSISAISGSDGVDQIFNVETAQFTDGNINLVERSLYNITSYVELHCNQNSTGAIYTATASDINLSANLTYTLAGPDADFFNIDANSGAISFKNISNLMNSQGADHNNVYNVTLRAFNGSVYSDAQEVAISGPKGAGAIDLGTGNGKLINPVEVDGGKWYYYWDRSGDGSNSGADSFTHDELNNIFNSDINGVVGIGGKTTDTYRYATLCGVQIALPTIGTLLALPSSQSYTALPGTEVGSEANATNPTYHDLSAVWDAYNGINTSTNQPGVPTGWGGGPYWSASSTNLGHALLDLRDGHAWNYPDNNSFYVAVQVL